MKYKNYSIDEGMERGKGSAMNKSDKSELE